MITAYRWQLHGFLLAMGILLAVQLVVLGIGLGAILRGYTTLQLDRLEGQAREILLTGDTGVVDHSGPFFVFSRDLRLVYSNRGRGRSIAAEDYRPVTHDGAVIGYFFTEGVRFLENSANRYVLVSLGVLAGTSMVLSFGIASAFAARWSRLLSTALRSLQGDIHTLRALKPVERRSLKLWELREISGSLRDVSVILSDQESYKRQWMQDIAHDLRSPISGIKGQLEGMRDGVLQPSEDRFERTLDDVTRLERLVASMTELLSIESNPSVPLEPIAAESFLEAVERAHEVALRDAGATLTWDTELSHIRGNRDLLMRAVANVVGNAIAYGGAGVAIHLAIDSVDGLDRIAIENDGAPIPEDQLPRIFQRFFRGEFARNTPGSGLGLSIAREVALRHNGRLEAQNLKPRGVRFCLYLGT